MASNNEFFKEYKTIGDQEYKITGDYDLGEYGHKRGYYLSVMKIKTEVKDGYTIETFTISFGSGRNSIRELLLEVNRKSKKSEDKAFDMITEERINSLIKSLN